MGAEEKGLEADLALSDSGNALEINALLGGALLALGAVRSSWGGAWLASRRNARQREAVVVGRAGLSIVEG